MFKDILSIENAADYGCHIRKFSVGHQVLHIQALSKNKPGNMFFIAFYPVEYFCGPFAWQGANFVIASDEECIEVLKKLERFRDRPVEKLLERPLRLKLYTVTTPKNLIQIVSREAQIHDQGWVLG